jgi:hypothetical protein
VHALVSGGLEYRLHRASRVVAMLVLLYRLDQHIVFWRGGGKRDGITPPPRGRAAIRWLIKRIDDLRAEPSGSAREQATRSSGGEARHVASPRPCLVEQLPQLSGQHARRTAREGLHGSREGRGPREVERRA